MKKIHFTDAALQQARERLSRRGVSMRQWADDHGFHHVLVRDILAGLRAANHGQSHNIAVLLGMKEGELNPRYLPEKIKHLLESDAA